MKQTQTLDVLNSRGWSRPPCIQTGEGGGGGGGGKPTVAINNVNTYHRLT